MDLIVVDSDSCSLWNVPEVERLLDAGHDAIWFLDNSLLQKSNYNVYLAAQIPPGTSIEKGILLTKMQNGVMKYHKEMLLNTFNCKYWIIVIVDVNNDTYRRQYCAGFNSALAGAALRYDIIFDDSRTLPETAQVKKETVAKYPYCIVATKTNRCLAEKVKAVLAVHNDEWHIACHVGLMNDAYKGADIILLAGETEEDYQVPPTEVNTGRVRIWVNLHRGELFPDVLKRQTARIVDTMNAAGWKLGVCDHKVFGSCLDYEVLLMELDQGIISAETLRTDDRFIIWDQYGLPFSESAYHNAEWAEEFLRQQCCLNSIF